MRATRSFASILVSRRWVKAVGAGAFLFFFVKGLVWLVIAGAASAVILF